MNTHNYCVSTKLYVNYKKSFNIAVIKHFCKIFQRYSKLKESQNLHTRFSQYIWELLRTRCTHGHERARNFSSANPGDFLHG